MTTTMADCISWEDLHAQILALEKRALLSDLFIITFGTACWNNSMGVQYEPRDEWLKKAMLRIRGEGPYSVGHLHLASATSHDYIRAEQFDFLFQLRSPVSAITFATVARCGGPRAVALLTWLRDPDTTGGRCQWNESACEQAAQAGPYAMSIIRALRNPDTMGGRCPWDANTTTAAINHGGKYTQNILVTLRGHPEKMGGRCPWNSITFCVAVSNDAVHSENLMRMLRCQSFILGGRCPWGPNVIEWVEEFGMAAAPALLHLLRSGELGGVPRLFA